MVRPSLEGACSITRYIFQFFGDFSQVFQRNFWVVNLTTPKADPHFDFFAFLQPAASISNFETTMMFTCFGSQSDLFDLDLGLCFTCFALFFLAFVDVFSYVHHPADGWIGIGSHFDQV